MNNELNNANQEQEIDFSFYFSVILKRIWLLAGFVFVGVLAALAVNTFMQPVYKSTVLMMIDREKAGKIETTSFGSWASDEDYYRTQYKLLESRSLLEKVCNKLNLSQYPEFASGTVWLQLKNHIKIVPITRSRLVNLEVESFDRQLSTDIANTIAKTFVEDNLTNRISIAKDVIAALEATERSQKQQELLNSMPQVVNSDFIKNLKRQEIDFSCLFVFLYVCYDITQTSLADSGL